MLGLEKIVAGAKLRGVAGLAIVEVVRVEWIGTDAPNVVYRGGEGPAEVLLFRDAEPRLEPGVNTHLPGIPPTTRPAGSARPRRFYAKVTLDPNGPTPQIS
jgi:hypothetical protein